MSASANNQLIERSSVAIKPSRLNACNIGFSLLLSLADLLQLRITIVTSDIGCSLTVKEEPQHDHVSTLTETELILLGLVILFNDSVINNVEVQSPTNITRRSIRNHYLTFLN